MKYGTATGGYSHFLRFLEQNVSLDYSTARSIARAKLDVFQISSFLLALKDPSRMCSRTGFHTSTFPFSKVLKEKDICDLNRNQTEMLRIYSLQHLDQVSLVRSWWL